MLTHGRLIAALLGFAAGWMLAFASHRSDGTGDPAGPGADRGARPSSAPSAPRAAGPSQDYETVIRMPAELLSEPEIRLALGALEAARVPEAIHHLRAAHQKFPEYVEPLLALGKSYLSQGDLRNAFVAAQKAVRAAPESVVSFLLLGRVLEAQGDRDGAEKAFLRAGELAPADPQPVFHVGRIAEARYQTDVAMSRFRRALELDPAFIPATYHLVGLLRNAGSHDEAARIISEALERAPRDANLRSRLADIRLMQGKWEDAVREFQLCAETVTNDPMIHYFSSTALEQLDRNEEAIEALRTALRQDPHLHQAWYALARLLGKTGDTVQAADALREFEKARALHDSIIKHEGHLNRFPTDLEAMLALAELLLDRGKPGDALKLSRRAIGLAPQDPRAQALLQRAEAEANGVPTVQKTGR